jgi:hypothetical protein
MFLCIIRLNPYPSAAQALLSRRLSEIQRVIIKTGNKVNVHLFVSQEWGLLGRYIGWSSVRITDVSVDSRLGQNTLSFLDSILALWADETLIKCVQEGSNVGVKRPGLVADHIGPNIAKV